MHNPVVLITGALTGIGRATATAFARDGARLVVSGRHEDAGRELVSDLQALGELLRERLRRWFRPVLRGQPGSFHARERMPAAGAAPQKNGRWGPFECVRMRPKSAVGLV